MNKREHYCTEHFSDFCHRIKSIRKGFDMLWGYSPLMAVKRCGWMWYLALEAFKCQIPGMRLAGVVHPAQPQCLVTVLSRMQAWEYFNCLF